MTREEKLAQTLERRRQDYIKGLAYLLQQGMMFGYPGPDAVIQDVAIEHTRITLASMAEHREDISDDLKANIKRTLASDATPVQLAALELLIEQETTRTQSSSTESSEHAPETPTHNEAGYI